jgi:outer membrane lipoprotein SlyB
MVRTLTVAVLSLSLLGACQSAQSQRAGQSARISVGIVEGAERVQVDSNAGRGALVGGALGLGLTRNSSNSRRAAATLGGAALAGGVASRSQGDRSGMRYTIRVSSGKAIQVVTDQTEIRLGDCVLVEETGSRANVRRKDPSMCDSAPPEVMAEVEEVLQYDANRCDDAKGRLLEATTPEEVQVAMQVMDILCND